jgi:hypothetical protein
MSKTAINRQLEGLAIANITGTIKRISELVYNVKFQNGNGEYDISSTDSWSVLYLNRYLLFRL